MKLHYNKSNGIFSVRRVDRSTLLATDKNYKIPFVGEWVKLAPSVHLIVTRGVFMTAKTEGSRPDVVVKVTKWPRLRLLVERLKEVF